MVQDTRPTTRLDDIEFLDHPHPELTSDGSGKSVQLEVLPQSEEEDTATVIQPMGREARTWTLRGTTIRRRASALDEMIGDVVTLRHARHSGDVYVDDVNTDPFGGSSSPDSDPDERWYTYTVTLTEVR